VCPILVCGIVTVGAAARIVFSYARKSLNSQKAPTGFGKADDVRTAT